MTVKMTRRSPFSQSYTVVYLYNHSHKDSLSAIDPGKKRREKGKKKRKKRKKKKKKEKKRKKKKRKKKKTALFFFALVFLKVRGDCG